MEILVKKCSGPCELILELNSINFYRDKYHKTRFDSRCKICSPIKKLTHIIIENNIKYQICTGECQLKLEINKDNFGYQKKYNKFVRKCRICMRKYGKEHYKENKDKINTRIKKHQSLPENKKIFNEKRRQKRINEPGYGLMNDISKLVRLMLKNHGNTKNGKSRKKYLPFTKEELINHVENQFKLPGNEWMNWSNHGVYKSSEWDDNNSLTWVWQLDHVIPQADLKYDSVDHPNLKLCWDLSNLRAYSAKLNHEDGVKRTRHK